MIRPFLFITLLILTPTLPTFAQDPPPAGLVPGERKMADRIQGPWVLRSWTVDGKKELNKDARISLVFSKKRIEGNAGVNSFSGTFRSVGSSLVLKLGAITEIAGTPEAMERETTYLQLLAKVADAHLKGNILTLRSRSGKVQLEFAIPPAPKRNPLVGTSWNLHLFAESKGETDSATSLVEGTSLTFTIDQGGKVTGSGGVNGYFGTARIGKAGRIEIGALGSTRKAGSPAAMKQEAHFFRALQESKVFVIKGKRLTLFNAAGTESLIFEAKAE